MEVVCQICSSMSKQYHETCHSPVECWSYKVNEIIKTLKEYAACVGVKGWYFPQQSMASRNQALWCTKIEFDSAPCQTYIRKYSWLKSCRSSTNANLIDYLSGNLHRPHVSTFNFREHVKRSGWNVVPNKFLLNSYNFFTLRSPNNLNPHLLQDNVTLLQSS